MLFIICIKILRDKLNYDVINIGDYLFEFLDYNPINVHMSVNNA